MTPDEIRKLLGGYATNTLTEVERRALMEAAVDDQELFNALQDEEALRELLADPASREQVRQALSEKPAQAWWRGGWMWSGVLAAAVAAALVIAVVQRKPPQPALQKQVQVATNQQPANAIARQKAPGAVAAAPQQKKAKALAKARTPVPAAAPAAPPAPAAETAPRAAVVGGFAGSLGAVNAARDAAAPAPLRYTVLRRSADGTFAPVPPGEKLKAGDAVRLRITPGMSGQLTLDRVSESGETTSLFPALAVETGMSYEVPEAAIELSGADRVLRIVLHTNGTAAVTADIPVAAN